MRVCWWQRLNLGGGRRVSVVEGKMEEIGDRHWMGLTSFFFFFFLGNYLFPPSTTSHCQHHPMN
jgi:hypothetical protein